MTKDGPPDGGNRYCLGLALIGGCQLSAEFGIGARGEYVRVEANDGGGDVWDLMAGTLPFDYQLTSFAAADAASGTRRMRGLWGATAVAVA